MLFTMLFIVVFLRGESTTEDMLIEIMPFDENEQVRILASLIIVNRRIKNIQIWDQSSYSYIETDFSVIL